MTPKQAEALEVIGRYINENGFSPTFDEIADAIGVSSKSTVHRIVDSLVSQGKITHSKGRARSINLVDHTGKDALLSRYQAFFVSTISALNDVESGERGERHILNVVRKARLEFLGQ